MKVLFVASGNSQNFEIAPFIKAQGESLKEQGIDLVYFPIIGKGIKGYLKSAKRLHLFIKENNVDILHAHYTLCGWAAVLSGTGLPIVISLMGSDAYGEYINEKGAGLKSKYLTLLTFLIQPFVSAIISKSSNIDKFVYRRRISQIIPNGVRLEQFILHEQGVREELGLERNRKYVLFLGDKQDKRKNFDLAIKAIHLLNDNNLEILSPYPISHTTVVKYLNAVDLVVLTSFMEGSPNIIKEAMACNCPIVATDVGDVGWLFGDEPGHYITVFDPEDVAEKIKLALEFSEKQGRTKGRERIIALGLDSQAIATRIVYVYNNMIKR